MDRKCQNKCKNVALKCKLYDVIHQLEGTVPLEYRVDNIDSNEIKENKSNKAAMTTSPKSEPKKAECSCSPGCCKDSMGFKPPQIMGKLTTPSHSSAQIPPNTPQSQYTWHSENHNNGCFPGGGQMSSPPDQSHNSPTHSRGGNVSPESACDMTPEEFQQRGCFIAKAA